MAGKVTGGYSIEAIYDSDKERFKCALCLDIVKIATQGCMNHVFCKECVKDYIESNRSKDELFCPAGCGQPFNMDELQFNKTIDHFVNTIACRCPDCSWTGELYDFVQQHELNCMEKNIQCHLCNEFIKRKELKAHVSDFCQNRKIDCQYCYKEVPYHEHAVHEDVCQNSEVKCYYKKFGCTELIKRKLMEIHNERSNQKHLFLITKYFEDKNESLQFANQKLETALHELEKQNTDMKYQILTHKLICPKNILSRESLKSVLDVGCKGMLVKKKCNIRFDLLKQYFDTKDYRNIAEDLIEACKELEEHKDELVELIETSPMTRFDKGFIFKLFFKKETFTAYPYFKSCGSLLEKRNEKYFFREQSFFSYRLYLSKWEIDLTNAPVDLSKPDERFRLSPQPFISDIYGCLQNLICLRKPETDL